MRVAVVLPEEFRFPFETLLKARYELEMDLETIFFTKIMDAATCVERFADKDAVVITLEDFGVHVLEKLPALKMVTIFGAGYDNVDIDAAVRLGVEVTNTPGANAPSVAEMAVSLLLSTCRHLPCLNKETRTGNWALHTGMELAGKTCGIIGLGKIGKELAKMLSGFEMRILAYEKYQDDSFAQEWNIEFTNLQELVERSDVISLHVPLLPETKNLMNEQVFSWMKRRPVLVNTSRGGVIDEDALIDALKQNKIRAAALDVLTEEPPGPDHVLRAFPQVTLTSHIGGSTADAVRCIGEMVLQDITDVREGRSPRHSVIPQKR